MTKTLLTVSYALDLDEDELAAFAQSVDRGTRAGIKQAMTESGREFSEEDIETLDSMVDYYGATLTLKQTLFEGLK